MSVFGTMGGHGFLSAAWAQTPTPNKAMTTSEYSRILNMKRPLESVLRQYCIRSDAGKQKAPTGGASRGFEINAWQCPTFTQGEPCTIIGAKWFHFRVRNGIGWCPLAMAARQTGLKGLTR